MEELKFLPPMPTDLIWKQYGAAILEQRPEEEWETRLLQVPPAYRTYIKKRLFLAANNLN